MEQQRIWEHYQAGGTSTDQMFAGAASRHEYIAGIIPAGSHVLNIGVGDGGLEQKLAARGCVAYSLDPNESSITRLRTALGLGERAKVGFSEAIPFGDEMFDIVVMSEVIEHLDDETLESSIAEVARVLLPSGRLVGTTPAGEDLAASECLCPACGTIFHRYGHVQSFGEDRLRQVLGGRFSEVRITRHYFPNLNTENWRGRIFRWLKQAQLRLGSTGSNETYVFDAVMSRAAANDE